MSAQRDPDRLINAFLMEGQTELADPVYDAVRASIEHKRQPVVIGPRTCHPYGNRSMTSVQAVHRAVVGGIIAYCADPKICP